MEADVAALEMILHQAEIFGFDMLEHAKVFMLAPSIFNWATQTLAYAFEKHI